MPAARGVSDGVNSRPLDDTLAETGPGLSDDAVLDGELAPGELDEGSDAAVAKLKREGWAPADGGSPEEETEAHPS